MPELLRTGSGVRAVTFGQVMHSHIRLPALMTAMAGATGNAAAAQALRALAARVSDRDLRLTTIIDLGPLADSIAADIDQRLVRTVSTNDLAAGVAGSLVRDGDLQARMLGLGLSAGGLTQAVGNILSVAAPAVDTLIGQVTALAGVRVGEADVRINGVPVRHADAGG